MLLLVLLGLLFSLVQSPECYAATDTISPGQALAGIDKIVSNNGRYALSFVQTGSKSFNNTVHWYLGIWFNKLPKLTTLWVANGDNPIADPTLCELTISLDGNLVILNQRTKSIVWSTQANTTTNTTIATLSDGGNLILRNSLNPSDIFWQSFDHPTNNLFPGAKLGRDKVTGLNRRLVSRKNSIDQAPGVYSFEIDPTGAAQLILRELNSGVTYWSSGEWNGQYFNAVPEMRTGDNKFVSNDQEEYYTYTIPDIRLVFHLSLEVYGQTKVFVWVEASQDWVNIFSQPRYQCDVYAICGPFTICNDNALSFCNCMKGFSIRSLKDWGLEDRTGGCMRNTPLDCSSNKSTTDKFYSIPCFRLPHNAQNIENATYESECAHVCLSNCSCTAYSFFNNGCYVWYYELLNVKQLQDNDPSNARVEILNLRLAAKEVQNLGKSRRRIAIGMATGATLGLFGLVLLLLMMIWRSQKKWTRHTLNNVQGGNGIVVFRYIDLQRATKNFSEKLGGGGFGSVFKGFLPDSGIIAVKILEGVRQGEKQFRAEVSSIGIIQHINLVKLIGFCCEGKRRLLVYDYMPNHSLDGHLFRSNVTLLNWHTRYQIAIGVARGLAYLHESCRDCIIHCDIKPQNILLDASFIPKIADFGMAKFLQRDFSRVVTTMRGTIGYLAPEWISGVAITTKVDVYSYGMLLLEIISGRSNTSEECTSRGDNAVYFPLKVAHNLLEGDVESLVDHRIYRDANLEEVERACKVACWCIQDEDFDRPTMGEVAQILEGLREVDKPPLPRLLQAIAGSWPSTSLQSKPYREQKNAKKRIEANEIDVEPETNIERRA